MKIKEETRYVYNDHINMSNLVFNIGMMFSDAKFLKLDFKIMQSRSPHVFKIDKKTIKQARCVVVCLTAMFASLKSGSTSFIIKTLN